MSGTVHEIPPHSAPREAFESRKSRDPSGRLSGNPRGAAGAGAGPVAVFTVEEFKKGVNVGIQGGAGESADALAGEGTPPRPLRLDGTGTGISSLAGDLPAGSYGRRYRPLENGRMADASLGVKDLSEEQKLGKLKQIKESAEEYEGFLIAEMIKSMRQSPFVKTPGGDTYSEIAEKPFTAALTAAGGLGLSQTIVNQVASQEGLADVLAARPEVMGPNWRQRLAPSQMTKPGPRLAAPPGAAEGISLAAGADGAPRTGDETGASRTGDADGDDGSTSE
jgi:Rod binding domain-containing protein